MQLPVDLSCAVWFFAHEVWEDEEPLPPPSLPAAGGNEPCGADPDCNGDAAQSLPGCASPGPPDAPAAPEPARQVFKGYSYETRFNWLPSDSPIARPWVQAPAHARSDERRQHADEADPLRLDSRSDPRLDPGLELGQAAPAPDASDPVR